MSKFETLEEYRAYRRAISKAYYERNKEKKKAYQKERYHKMMQELRKKEEANQ